ncbi:unnamed protein product [Blepharisma stoltei]|uniref:RING-type domain-containing protein n=1 Tax=Blepharisma stoltei TaxID=1481888 RepID=A0AAU9JNN8_9CILI|nr:unnamed protein product [Blepharisma stoltei]
MRTSDKIFYAIAGIATIVVTSIFAVKLSKYRELLNLKETTIEDFKKRSSKSKNDLVCISGIVRQKNSFKSKFDQTYGDIVYSRIVEKGLKKKSIITGGLFTLLDKKSQIDVKAGSYTKIYINPIYTKTEPFLSLLTSWMSTSDYFKTTTEKVIACDSAIVVIGKASQNIITADYIGHTKGIILKRILKKLRFITLVTLVLWSAWLSDAWRITREKWTEWKRKRYNKKFGEIPDRYKCIICFENNRDTIIEPCKHMCLCSGCNINLANCPVCRVLIRGVTRIYPIDE